MLRDHTDSDRREPSTGRHVRGESGGGGPACQDPLRAPAAAQVGFQAQNLMLALAAARQVLGEVDWDPTFQVRLQYVDTGQGSAGPGDPDVIYDAAHDPGGARGARRVAPGLAPRPPGDLLPRDARGKGRDRHRRRACARGLPHCVYRRSLRSASRTPRRPAERAGRRSRWRRLCEESGGGRRAIRIPLAAWERARELARERGGGRAGGRQSLPSVVAYGQRGPLRALDDDGTRRRGRGGGDPRSSSPSATCSACSFSDQGERPVNPARRQGSTHPIRKYVHSRLPIPMPLALFGLDGGVGLIVNLLDPLPDRRLFWR